MQGVSSIEGTLFFMPCKSVEERWENEVDTHDALPVRLYAPRADRSAVAHKPGKRGRKNKNF